MRIQKKFSLHPLGLIPKEMCIRKSEICFEVAAFSFIVFFPPK